MSTLANLQADIRHALVSGDASRLEPMFVDGRRRIFVHQRHYAASLSRAVVDRFPATVWLVGSTLVTDAARQFVRQHPPSRPCIAEYGEEFPAYLATQAGADVPYLCQFAELEWHVGRLALAVDARPVTLSELSVADGAALASARVVLQPGIHFMPTGWAIDELLSHYLADDAPDQFSLDAGEFWLELRGVRGELSMKRLTQPEFVFRSTVAGGRSLGAAAVAALDVDEGFDAGQAMLSLFRDELVIDIDNPHLDGAV